MSAAMQAYIAVRQGSLMERWLQQRCPFPSMYGTPIRTSA